MIREAWLPEPRRAYVLMAPLGVCILTGTIWSSTEVSTDDVPTKTGAAPWISGWCGLLQFSILHRPRRVYDFARWSLLEGCLRQRKHSLFFLANWARSLTLRALKVQQSSMLWCCEQIEQGLCSYIIGGFQVTFVAWALKGFTRDIKHVVQWL